MAFTYFRTVRKSDYPYNKKTDDLQNWVLKLHFMVAF